MLPCGFVVGAALHTPTARHSFQQQQQQQDTLIVWSENESCDLALSFQEKAGCDEVWARICQVEVQGKDPSSDATQDTTFDADTEEVEPTVSVSGGGGGGGGGGGTGLRLPRCEVSQLKEISDLFATCLGNAARRDLLAISIEHDRYIEKLMEVFRMCEDLESVDSLRLIYQIVKCIIMLNKNSLLEVMFSDEHLRDVVGALEYGGGERRRHRDFLWHRATFREVIPIRNADLKAKIHQTFRVQYVQDVVLPAPSIFEENMLASLSSFLFFNKVEIVSLIQDDEAFLNDLFGEMTTVDTPPERLRDLTLFLKEFCTFAQTLQPQGPQGRDSFFRTLMSHGIHKALERCLSATDERTRAAAIEIFAMIVDYSPAFAREHMLDDYKKAQAGKPLLINVLIEQLFTDPDPELSSAMQLLNVLRILVDPENMMANATAKPDKPDFLVVYPMQFSSKQEFLSFFYKHAMNTLVKPLVDNTAGDEPLNDDYHRAHQLSLVLEMLSFCIEHHTYHIRNYMMNRDVLKKVLVLLKSRHAFLALGALRMFRRVVALKDEFYCRHIVAKQLLGPIVECYRQNGHCYNLLNSALLELFEYIRSEDIRSLLMPFVDNYIEQFADVDYVKTFAQLKIRYEQNKDREQYSGSPMIGSSAETSGRSPPTAWQRAALVREPDKRESDWFNEEEEEWENELPAAPEVPTPSDEALSPTPPAPRSVAEDDDDQLPSLLRTNNKPADVPGAFSPRPLRTISFGSQPRIVIKPPSPQLVSLVVSSSADSAAAEPPVADALAAETVSSTTTCPPAVSAPARTRGLVDYELGDSDSEDDEAAEADAVRPGATVAPVVRGDVADVSSTSERGAHADRGDSPERKRLRFNADQPTDSLLEQHSSDT